MLQFMVELDKNGFTCVNNFFTDDEIEILRDYAVKTLDSRHENSADVPIDETHKVLLSEIFIFCFKFNGRK